jgi:hypothetical protein
MVSPYLKPVLHLDVLQKQVAFEFQQVNDACSRQLPRSDGGLCFLRRENSRDDQIESDALSDQKQKFEVEGNDPEEADALHGDEGQNNESECGEDNDGSLGDVGRNSESKGGAGQDSALENDVGNDESWCRLGGCDAPGEDGEIPDGEGLNGEFRGGEVVRDDVDLSDKVHDVDQSGVVRGVNPNDVVHDVDLSEFRDAHQKCALRIPSKYADALIDRMDFHCMLEI